MTISLEDGFDKDHVIIAVDDAVVFDEDQVSTRYQIGLAREITVAAPAATCRVRVELPERGLDGALAVDTDQTPAVLVSVVDGRLQLQPTDRPRHA